jgi:hypothetical protein
MKIKSAIGIAVFLLASLSAFAGNITFIGTGPYNYLGEPSYQYHFSDGINRMCINDDRFISPGETWQVTVEPVTTPIEQQAAWLLQHAGDGSNPDYQGAVWYLFNNNTALTAGAAELLQEVQGMNFTSGEFDNVHLYVPTGNDAGWTNGIPQTMLGETPEPATMLLVGSGLIGLFSQRKRLFS